MTDQYGPLYTNFGNEPTPQVGDEAPYYAPPVAAPSWGTPPALTSPDPAMAAATSRLPGSVLQSLLSAAGLITPPTSVDYAPPAPTGGDNFTRNFLLGITPLQQQQAMATGQISNDITNDRVYMGHTETNLVADVQHIGLAGDTTSELAPPTKSETTHKTTTVEAALSQPYLWSDDKVTETMKKMREAGINVASFEDMLGAWGNLVTRASRTFTLSGGDSLVTPWDMLSATKKENIANGTLDKDGNIVSVSKSTSVNDLTEGQAWGTLQQTMQQMLGRDPTDQEVRDFLSAANADAARDPGHTTTTTRTDTETGNSRTSSVTRGGYNEADAAKSAYEDIHNDADYGQFQSATTYFNAMLSALGEVAGSS